MLEAPFQEIDIYMFDVHTTIKPLASNDCLQDNFRFLVEPDNYREHYTKRTTTLTKSFDIHPLSLHAQTRNHFWKNYLNLFAEADPDFWQLQAPFVCSLRQPSLTLAEDLGFAGSIRPRIYLSALGWSTQLNIHLKGDIHLSALLKFILGIVGNEGNSGLRLDGQPASVSFIFRNLADRLLEEVYDKAHPPKTGAPEIPKRMVISLSKFQGTPLHYKKKLGRSGMTDEEQALLHSLLRGETIKVKELAQKLQKPLHTLVRFDPDADFMLIYFEYGALVFMQRSARLNNKRQRSLSCFGSNTRSYATMIWTLFHFYLQAANAVNPAVKDLREKVKANLLAMGNKYIASADGTRDSVQFGKAFFKNHDLLSKFLAQG